jgi:predicted dehydrogenase
MTADLRVAVVGLGYWGPNVLRNAYEIEGIEIVLACDKDMAALERQGRRWQSLRVTASVDDVLESPDVDAVVLVTPIATHYDLARRALTAGKHVMVEKPLANTVEQCRELIEMADRNGLVLMPGHTFLYSPPVLAVKELIDAGELGRIYFGTSSRVNLGIHQRDISVVRDLGPHDFSILLYWLGEPEFVRAIGRDAIVPGNLDVAFVDVGYPDGCLVHLELSWLAPTKLRRTVLVGSRKMVVYEDTSPEQVRVFDRCAEPIEPQSFGEFQLSYRSGDVLIPRIDADEPLKLELEDFVRCVRSDDEPRSSPGLGLDVVRLVEAAEASLMFNGAPVPVGTPPYERRSQPDRRRNVAGRPCLHPVPS